MCTALFWLLLACPLAQASDIPNLLRQEGKIIFVGVRDADKPFSYKSANRSNSRILPGYGGYMIEICRKVLEELVSDGYFAGYRVLAREVNSGNRFSMLNTGQIDILCGPDSITQNRLERYATSHPVFLSGVVLVSQPAEDFPRSRYCQAVFGVVRGTSAEVYGLEQLLGEADIIRFKPALLSFLAQFNEANADPFRSTFEISLDRWIESDGELGVVDKWFENGRSLINPGSVRTYECRDGYENGPVVFYTNHQQGIESFCRGDTLFYLGDVDLLRSKFDVHSGCEKVFQRTTLTREVYGIYFRKVAAINEKNFSRYDQRDAVLYAQFNNILLRKTQGSERIMEYEYKQEFGDQAQSEDLIQFFESFQYANSFHNY